MYAFLKKKKATKNFRVVQDVCLLYVTLCILCLRTDIPNYFLWLYAWTEY